MLETKIEELTVAINKLVAVMQYPDVPSDPIPEKPKAVEKVAKAVEEPAEQSEEQSEYTPEMLQSLALQAVRADKNNKAKIAELLSGYGASLIKEVPKDKLGELAAALKALG